MASQSWSEKSASNCASMPSNSISVFATVLLLTSSNVTPSIRTATSQPVCAAWEGGPFSFSFVLTPEISGTAICAAIPTTRRSATSTATDRYTRTSKPRTATLGKPLGGAPGRS
ncbi:hypothetical protein Vafri_3518 [Volvox africanus]|uniref:Uncharacterized protein n=1 Tax=Volvox africanus TaxID=51714 RepID=A0A8J4ARN1_9CHLO|nr:hypothetical protein Vafri_3518 [Volvox africanus]